MVFGGKLVMIKAVMTCAPDRISEVTDMVELDA